VVIGAEFGIEVHNGFKVGVVVGVEVFGIEGWS